MSYGILTVLSDGTQQLTDDYAPYNFISSIYLTESSPSGFQTFSVGEGRKLIASSVQQDTYGHGCFVISVSGSTVSWTRSGKPYTTCVYICTIKA